LEELGLTININNILEMKTPHPCGCKKWLVLKSGIELRLKCQGCGHIVLVERSKIEKKIKNIISNEEP
jgi:hypothetical protein